MRVNASACLSAPFLVNYHLSPIHQKGWKEEESGGKIRREKQFKILHLLPIWVGMFRYGIAYQMRMKSVCLCVYLSATSVHLASQSGASVRLPKAAFSKVILISFVLSFHVLYFSFFL